MLGDAGEGGLVINRIFKKIIKTIFSPNWPLGRFGLVVALSICLSPVSCHFLCVRGLVRSVTRPWTGVERPSPSHGALKTGRCSEMDASSPSGY